MIAVSLAILLNLWSTPDGGPSAAFEKTRAEVVRAAVKAIDPCVVTIETIGGAQPVQRLDSRGIVVEEAFRVADGPTTGVILAKDGLIITSSFNFARDPSVITVVLADGRRFVGRLLGRDLIRRLAVVKIDAADLPVPTWLSREELQLGQYLIACGRGLSGHATHVSLGIASAFGRRNGCAIQTDAKTSPINYGGPLVDIEGRVAGIIVPMAGAGGSLAGAEWYDSGIGFAIYKDRIDLVLERLLAGQVIEPGKIGVVLVPDEESAFPLLEKFWSPGGGVKIGRVARKSPAARARLRADDRILALDGQPIGDLADLQRRLSDRSAGENVTLSIRRGQRKLEVRLTLARVADIEGLQEEEVPEDAPGKPTTKPAGPPSSQPSD